MPRWPNESTLAGGLGVGQAGLEVSEPDGAGHRQLLRKLTVVEQRYRRRYRGPGGGNPAMAARLARSWSYWRAPRS